MSGQATADAPAHQAHLGETVAAGEAVLSSTLARPVGLALEKSFRRAGSRSTVVRCRVTAAPGETSPQGVRGRPEYVIVKRFLGDGGKPYDRRDTGNNAPFPRFLNEWTGIAFLSGVSTLGMGRGMAQGTTPGGEGRFCPGFFGADSERGVVVLEDLGDGESLADRLQGTDAAGAEAALLAYATTVGRLQAATVGNEAAYAALRAAARGPAPEPASGFEGWLAESVPRFRETCLALDVPLSETGVRELEDVDAIIAAPGPFLAFTPADTCPDNHRLYLSDQQGTAQDGHDRPGGGVAGGAEYGHVRFFDMEFSGFRHGLLDAAYAWMPFPSCWCVNGLPERLSRRMEAAYRAALAAGCPAAADDAVFGRALAAACVWWLVRTYHWAFPWVLERDDQWGPATHRQRLPLRAENVAGVCARTGQFPAVAALCRTMAATLRTRWGPAVEMPVYPPFLQA